MEVTVYYLEMLAAPTDAPAAPPREGLSVIHAHRPSVAYYRFLYDTVGRDYNWYSRRAMPDDQLGALLADEATEVHVLHVDGTPAGFVELDRRTEGEVEIVQFGLMPWYIGQGLGRYFLRWTIDQAWSYAPRRVWLHTCTEDHAKALPNYLAAGFKLYRETVRLRYT